MNLLKNLPDYVFYVNLDCFKSLKINSRTLRLMCKWTQLWNSKNCKAGSFSTPGRAAECFAASSSHWLDA